jgi:hypothetical protein
MSEYQYYEFQTVDRPLSEEERHEISSWSSRTTPTLNQAIFTYSYSDFPKSPKKVVEEYFDAMIYLSNWGSKRLMFRFPRSIIDAELFTPYCLFDSVSTIVTEDYIILDLFFNDEEGGGNWIEGEGWLSSLIMLRNDILNGDYRILYLAWLNSLNFEYNIEDYLEKQEPPIPDNLQNLSAPLKSFIEFFEIDKDLIDAASVASINRTSSTEFDIEKSVAQLSEAERINFLVRLAKGEDHVNLLLKKRLKEVFSEKTKSNNPSQRRTIGAILKLSKDILKQRKEAERKEAERARIHRLQQLEKKEAELWKQVFVLINTKKTNAYDEAVNILKDLRDLAKHFNQIDQFNSMINKIYKDNNRLSGLKFRLNQAGLTIRKPA